MTKYYPYLKDKINILLTYLKKIYSASSFMVIVGLCLFTLFIYTRFIRMRLPKDIPFQLNFYGFIILLFICVVYLYLIKILIMPKAPSITTSKVKTYFNPPIHYLLTSLSIFDDKIKHNYVLEPYYEKIKEHLVSYALNFRSLLRMILIYLYKIIPGYILLSIFMVDVFYLKKIEIFYYFIFLNLMPLAYSYYKYSLGKIKEEYFIYLESIYDYIKMEDENSTFLPQEERNPDAFYHEEIVSIREYFAIQLKQLDIEWPEYDADDPKTRKISYIGHAYSKSNIYEIYKKRYAKTITEFTEEEFNSLQKEFKEIEPKLLGLLEYLDLNPYTYNLYYIKELRVIMYSLYFITWTYVLVKSFHTLDINYIYILEHLKAKYENPFL